MMINLSQKITWKIILVLLLGSCNSQTADSNSVNLPDDTTKALLKGATIQIKSIDKSALEGNWINLIDSLPEAIFNIRYATKNNFTGKQIYPCAACYLRPEAAKALMKVSDEANKSGYKILIYDCYRPLDVQKILWEIKPDAAYVTSPSVGSQHNRGLAVDLTLADIEGKPIDMGNLYDDFSTKSHWNYKKLPAESLANRNLLKALMKKQGFDTINSEWWHYSFNRVRYSIENELWKCN